VDTIAKLVEDMISRTNELMQPNPGMNFLLLPYLCMCTVVKKHTPAVFLNIFK